MNDALKSFAPGQWHGDVQGVFPPITEAMSLVEAAALYQRMLDPRGEWWWPPLPKAPPLTEEQRSVEEAGDAYLLSLCNGDEAEFARRKTEIAEHNSSAGVVYADTTPFPLDPTPPPRVPVIRGEVVHEEPAPTDDELRRAVAEQPDEDEHGGMSEMAKAARMAKRLKRSRGGGRLSDRVKVFFK